MRNRVTYNVTSKGSSANLTEKKYIIVIIRSLKSSERIFSKEMKTGKCNATDFELIPSNGAVFRNKRTSLRP